MKKERDRVRLREVEVERLVVRQPGRRRARATLEVIPTRRGGAARVVLSLLAPDGEPVLVAEVDHRGQPRLSIGSPDHGPSVIITRQAVDVWSQRNVVASIRSDGGKGALEVLDENTASLSGSGSPATRSSREDAMQRLFDSHGHHIANERGGRLYAAHGSNIGRYIEHAGIFVDISGRYLGEVVHGNRLLSRRSSPHRGTNYGNAGSTGSIGNFGNPGNHGSIGMPGGFEDIEESRLE